MSRWFWPCVVVGWLFIAFGIALALQQPGASQPPVLAVFVLGLLVIHDFIIAPLTCAVGSKMRRVQTGRKRATIEAAMIISVIVAGFSIPLIAGWGDVPDNPSMLPGNYALGLGLILTMTWGVAAIALYRHKPAAGESAGAEP